MMVDIRVRPRSSASNYGSVNNYVFAAAPARLSPPVGRRRRVTRVASATSATMMPTMIRLLRISTAPNRLGDRFPSCSSPRAGGLLAPSVLASIMPPAAWLWATALCPGLVGATVCALLVWANPNVIPATIRAAAKDGSILARRSSGIVKKQCGDYVRGGLDARHRKSQRYL